MSRRRDPLDDPVRGPRGSYARMRCALLILTLAPAGCTTMPERFHAGSPEIHPRFGYHITNETQDHFDLEIIVMDRSCFYTHGDDEVERARQVFVEFLRAYADERQVEVDEPPLVELNAFQVRGNFGTNTTRVGKRIRIVNDRPGGRRLRLTNAGQ